MTRDELVTAVKATGANQLATLTLERFADEAVREFDAEDLWPWRITEQTGTAPLAVTLLGPIDSVRTAEFVPLTPRRHSELVEERRDFTITGNARHYYVQGGSVRCWPVSLVEITVRHYAQGGWTTGGETAGSGADSPRADTRWHDAILLLMRLRATMEDRDWESSKNLWERYQARLEQCRQAELRDNWDEPDIQRCSEMY